MAPLPAAAQQPTVALVGGDGRHYGAHAEVADSDNRKEPVRLVTGRLTWNLIMVLVNFL